MRKFSLAIIALLFVLASTLHAQDDPTTAPFIEEGIAVVSSPVDGQPLFGLVEIIGTARHPSLFQSYTLNWRNAQSTEDLWLPIQEPISQQVTAGILGQWDTVGTGRPDGIYDIRLRMILSDGTFQEFIVRNIRLSNSTPTELPTIQPDLPTATLPTLPITGETPTPLIQQPPTVTPRPTFESPSTASNSSGDSGESEVVNFGAIQSAFCTGVFFSLGMFAVIIAYLLLRSQISPFTRRLWWQIRSELDNDGE
jgi:hypothetical protein